MAMIIGPPDQPAERLRQPAHHHPIIKAITATRQPPGRVQHGAARPGHAFHNHLPQGRARHIHPIAQRIRA